MLVYSGKPCSTDRYVIDSSVLEERDQPTLDGGEYDHDACGLMGDDSAVSPQLGDEGSAFCLSDPAEKILVGPADTDTLWSRKMCDIYFGQLRYGTTVTAGTPTASACYSMICSANNLDLWELRNNNVLF